MGFLHLLEGEEEEHLQTVHMDSSWAERQDNLRSAAAAAADAFVGIGCKRKLADMVPVAAAAAVAVVIDWDIANFVVD